MIVAAASVRGSGRRRHRQDHISSIPTRPVVAKVGRHRADASELPVRTPAAVRAMGGRREPEIGSRRVMRAGALLSKDF